MMTETRIRDSRCTWAGEVTWRDTATLREQLLDLLEAPGTGPVTVDVTGVERIDRTGIALLVGSSRRAAAIGRGLVLVDRAGIVSTALSGVGVRSSFSIRTGAEPAGDPATVTGPPA